MTRRTASWQAEKARTAKALRELPKCELCEFKCGMGFAFEGYWLCPYCARFMADVHVRAEQRAQRERRT